MGTRSERQAIKVGFVPMSDCAPLIAADALGLFKKHGLNIRLSREAGWASVRERILHRELDAAHAHASMIFELGFGLGGRAFSCQTGVMLSHNGSAISLSNELWNLGARDLRSLKKLIDDLKGRRRLKFAVVLRYSTQNYLLRRWLKQASIDPDQDVEIVVVPPQQVVTCIHKGLIDGFCAGEPWSSIGTLKELCWCAAFTSEVAPMHPEKVLLVSKAFEESRHDEHLAMIAAIIEAAQFCDKPINRESLAAMLSQPCYFDVSVQSLLNGLQGPFQRGLGRQSSALDTIVYHRSGASEPSEEKARWVLREIAKNNLPGPSPNLSSDTLKNYFRSDLYQEALSLIQTPENQIVKKNNQ